MYLGQKLASHCIFALDCLPTVLTISLVHSFGRSKFCESVEDGLRVTEREIIITILVLQVSHCVNSGSSENSQFLLKATRFNSNSVMPTTFSKISTEPEKRVSSLSPLESPF